MARTDADETEPAWIDAGGGYALALDGGKLVARNPKGARIASLPKTLKNSELAERLGSLADFLSAHERACLAQVEEWMLRGEPVLRAVVIAVWDDPAWRLALKNAVVAGAVTGFLRGADAARGIAVLDRAGQTRWLDTDRVALPHPLALKDAARWRELAEDLRLVQRLDQLSRETFPRGSVRELEGARFAQLGKAIARVRALGYRMRGGFASCAVAENGAAVEARSWIGTGAIDAPVTTGELAFVDARGRRVRIDDVGPIAWSEGMRMVSAIRAASEVES